jgi:2-(1,2-epoxy-1,2-dihydrophenyl)acetyl-CoA isomerase
MFTMSVETVLFDVADNVATITMNRPDEANALNVTMAQEFAKLAIRCDEDGDIRAVVLTGAGRFFSAGGDVASFGAAGDDAAALIKEMTMYFHAAISRFNRMDAPFIGAVNGIAAGAGFSFVTACDLVVAAESAVFLSAYTAAALSPDGSSSYFLPRQIGMKRSAELMLTNRRLSAQEALEWGIVNRVVPDGDALEAAQDLARDLAAGPTLAFGAVKHLLHESLTSSLETQMELEARTIADMTRTDDGKEGITAFLNKRKPEFRGR